MCKLEEKLQFLKLVNLQSNIKTRLKRLRKVSEFSTWPVLSCLVLFQYCPTPKKERTGRRTGVGVQLMLSASGDIPGEIFHRLLLEIIIDCRFV